MRLLVDAQLPPALAIWFHASSHGAEHVADKGLAQRPKMQQCGRELRIGKRCLTDASVVSALDTRRSYDVYTLYQRP
jgi:hypothetical protein